MDHINDDYHQQLAGRYEKRKLTLNNDELAKVLAIIGFEVDPNTIEKAAGGNVSGTFLTPGYAIKIQNDKTRHEFLANEIISKEFSGKLPIVDVLAYDWFGKTEYEILVMKRGNGELLLKDFHKLSPALQKDIFGQILEIVSATSELVCSDFGEIRLGQSFKTFKEYLAHEFDEYAGTILEQQLCAKDDIEKVSVYLHKHLDIFDDEKTAYFNHTDVHTGNVLYNGDKVTLLFDFDGAIKGPKYLSLPKIIGAIDEPSQFVEGTPYFEFYDGKKFENLFPVLREKMSNTLALPNIVRKLNLIGIIEGMKWISENWSAEWNKNQIKKLLAEELAENKKALGESYYGKIFN